MNTATNTPAINYLPFTAAILVLAVVIFVSDLRAWGQPAIVVQPTPTPVVIVIATPQAATVEDQLAGLRGQLANQASGSLPSLDQFRAGWNSQAQPTPVRSIEEIILPSSQGAPVVYRVHREDGQVTAIEGAGILYACTDVLAGSIAHWESWPDYMRSQMASICGGGA